MKMVKMKSGLFFAVILAVSTAGMWFVYSYHNVNATEAEASVPPQALPVTVATVKPQAVKLWNNYSGHIVAVDKADIRPQVSGRITEIRFEDGQYVEKGDILIVIDPRPYEAALQQAEAELTSAQTAATLAQKEYDRAKTLIETEAISQSVFDHRMNARTAADAAVKAAQARVATARLDMDYAYVKAPIAGKVSRAEITLGNLVQAGSGAPLLTSIVSDGDVYVDFEVDENTYIQSVQASDDAAAGQIPVQLKIGGDLLAGHVHSFDNRIDPASGTIRARAIFSNDSKMLLPGMSVSIAMAEPAQNDNILISERAIGTDQDRKFVYVVDENNQAKYRGVTLGESLDGQRVILSGLENGDKVIVKGIVRVRPDMPVSPQEETDAENMQGVKAEL